VVYRAGERDMIVYAPRSAKPMTYDEALLYCSFCDHDGYTDWRLPTKEEYFYGPTIFGWNEYDEEDNTVFATTGKSWYIGRYNFRLWFVTPVREV
jgi:hypothetical protein